MDTGLGFPSDELPTRRRVLTMVLSGLSGHLPHLFGRPWRLRSMRGLRQVIFSTYH